MQAVTYFIVDVNECNESIHNCNVHAMCNDTDGSYTCTCSNGYTGNGVECISEYGLNSSFCLH